MKLLLLIFLLSCSNVSVENEEEAIKLPDFFVLTVDVNYESHDLIINRSDSIIGYNINIQNSYIYELSIKKYSTITFSIISKENTGYIEFFYNDDAISKKFTGSRINIEYKNGDFREIN